MTARRKHWLCIAYAFPPINRSGTHRTLAFVKHLSKLGWDATVLTVEPRDESLDSTLLAEVPAQAEVIRTPWTHLIERIKNSAWVPRHVPKWKRDAPCSARVTKSLSHKPPLPPRERVGVRAFETGSKVSGLTDPCSLSGRDGALPGGRLPGGDCRGVAGAEPCHPRWGQGRGIREWLTRLLMTPDSRIGWIAPAVRAGLAAVRRRRPDVIYSTSPYMSAHLIALILNRFTRVPWVADFRDPWRGNPFAASGSWGLDWWDSRLEGMVLRRATHIVCASPAMTQHLQERRSFVAGRCTTIMNGYDAERFEHVTPRRAAPAEDFVLTHCGQFYGPRSPRIWFAALCRALERFPRHSSRVRLVLIGSQKFNGLGLQQLAEEARVADRVDVLGPKSHAETLAYMAGSDALVLAAGAGAGADLQIPNKLFEYLAVRKPIIATCSSDSPVVGILRQARAEALVCNPNDEHRLAEAVAELAGHRLPAMAAAWSGVDQFERAHRAAQLLTVFRRLSSPDLDAAEKAIDLPTPSAAPQPT